MLSFGFYLTFLEFSGAEFTKNLKICPKIVLSLSYDINLRSAKIILRLP